MSEASDPRAQAMRVASRRFALLRDGGADKIEAFSQGFAQALKNPALARKIGGRSGWDHVLEPIERQMECPKKRAAAWRAGQSAALFKRQGPEAPQWAAQALRAASRLDAGPGSLDLLQDAKRCLERVSAHERQIAALAALRALTSSSPEQGAVDPDADAKAQALLPMLRCWEDPSRGLDSVALAVTLEGFFRAPAQGVAALLNACAHALAQTPKPLSARHALGWVFLGAEALRQCAAGPFEAQRAQAGVELLFLALDSRPHSTQWLDGSFEKELIGKGLAGPMRSDAPMVFARAALKAIDAGILPSAQFDSPQARAAFAALLDERALSQQGPCPAKAPARL